MQLLSDTKSSPSDKHSALDLIHAVLEALPVSLRQQSGQIEQCLIKLIRDHSNSKDSGSLLESGAASLALIPRIQGTAEVWSSFTRRSLISFSEAIDAALMGLGDQVLAAKGKETLVSDLSNVDSLLGPLPNLGGGLKGSLVPAINNLSVLITLLENLLSASYPLPLPLSHHIRQSSSKGSS